MEQKEKQFDMLKVELLLTQQQMDKYDQILATTKTWAVTLWAAALGWAFQTKRKEIILLGAAILGIFWFLDALNKTFRQNYKNRRDEVCGALRHFYRTNMAPENFMSPQLPSQAGRAWKNAFLLHIMLPYFLLACISLLLYFRF